MQIYDILMLAILLGCGFLGFWKGFAWQVASVASIVVSYFVALNFRGPVSALIDAAEPWNIFLAMLILYIAASAAVWIGFQMVSGAIERLRLREWDRHIGALLGLAKGSLICVLVTFFAVTLLGATQRKEIIHSNSGYAIAVVLHNADLVMPTEVQQVVAPYLDDFGKKLARPLDEGERAGRLAGLDIQMPGPIATYDPADPPLKEEHLGNLLRFLSERASGEVDAPVQP